QLLHVPALATDRMDRIMNGFGAPTKYHALVNMYVCNCKILAAQRNHTTLFRYKILSVSFWSLLPACPLVLLTIRANWVPHMCVRDILRVQLLVQLDRSFWPAKSLTMCLLCRYYDIPTLAQNHSSRLHREILQSARLHCQSASQSSHLKV